MLNLSKPLLYFYITILFILISASQTVYGQECKPPKKLDEVKIYTDQYNVSHIYTDDLYSLAYANGWVQARDRLFHMDMLRHTGYGNSSKVVGPAGLERDLSISRRLYTKKEMKEQYKALPSKMKTLLRGYSAGVNQKMCELSESGNYPAEFYLFMHFPKRWSPIDSVAVANYLIGIFGMSGKGQLRTGKTLDMFTDKFGSKREAYNAYKDINWLRTRKSHYSSIAPSEKQVTFGNDPLRFDELPQSQWRGIEASLGMKKWGRIDSAYDTMTEFPEPGSTTISKLSESIHGYLSDPTPDRARLGSNALVIGGELTETGESMMFGGPQMAYFKPPLLYEIGLHGAGWNMSGAGITGLPGTIMGQTDEFGWTMTSGNEDMLDYMLVELHPTDRHKYRWNGKWREMKCHTVTHNPSVPAGFLSGDPQLQPVHQEVCRIHEKGTKMPVISWNKDKRLAWVERRVLWMDEANVALPWLELATQDSLDEFQNTLEEFPAGFNFLYADPDNIAYIHTAKIPETNSNYDHRFPAPLEAKTWGEMKFSQQLGTYTVNPDRGYVINWNNSPVHGWRAGNNEQLYGELHRVNILDHFVKKQLNKTNNSLDIKDVNTILEKTAKHDPVARGSTPKLIEIAGEHGDSVVRNMAVKLQEWANDDYVWLDSNGDDRYDHSGHAIWDEVYRKLHRLTFSDEFGDLLPELHFNPPESADPHAGDHGKTDINRSRPTYKLTMVNALQGETNHNWFDDISTDRKETRQEIVLEAFENAHKQLTRQFDSPDPDDWKKREHKNRFKPLGLGTSNTQDMVNRGSWNFLIDFSNEIRPMKSVLPPSNTAHMNFGDFLAKITGGEPESMTEQLEIYKNFEYKPYPLRKSEVKETAVSNTTF